ncbi:hypothetical protein M9Y10_032807 [Tritrichomonas musculus]|uniref:Uncharacterized protein n=1 Tax=Tritrichomonas musculus TaxID=1915356 RepID=A0ABR2GXU4_9EUKA
MCDSLHSFAYYGEKDPAPAYILPFYECPLLKTANVTSKYADRKFCQLDVVIIDQNDNDDASSIICSDEKEIDSSSETIFISDDTQNSESSQQTEQDQTSDSNQNSDGAQTSENIHESENGQISDDTQNSDNIQNSDEESSSIFVPIPDATPTPKPIIVIIIDQII